jgi:hypothetical protein
MTSRCDRDLKEKVAYRAFSFLAVSCPAYAFRPRLYGSSIVLNKKKENTHECMDANNKVLSTFENSFRHGMCVFCAPYPHHTCAALAAAAARCSQFTFMHLISALPTNAGSAAARESMTNFPTQTFMLDT